MRVIRMAMASGMSAVTPTTGTSGRGCFGTPTSAWPMPRNVAQPSNTPAPRGVSPGHGPARYGFNAGAPRSPPARTGPRHEDNLVRLALPLVDYHVHTARCGHASGDMESYVEHAIEAGIAELGFSDHLFMYWLSAGHRDPELGMAEWEHDFYIQDVERCRARYGADIAIRLSTEADFIPGHARALERILRGHH